MRRIPEILEDGENSLSERFRAELNGVLEELRHIDEQVVHCDAQIQAIAQSHETVQRLMTIPGHWRPRGHGAGGPRGRGCQPVS